MGCGTGLRTAILRLSQTPFLRAVMGERDPIGRGDAERNGDGVEHRLTSENRAHVVYVDARLQVGRLAPVVREHR